MHFVSKFIVIFMPHFFRHSTAPYYYLKMTDTSSEDGRSRGYATIVVANAMLPLISKKRRKNLAE